MRARAAGLCAALLLTSCGALLADERSAAGTSGRADLRPLLPTIAYVMVGADPLVTGDRPVYLRSPGATPAEVGTGYYLAAAGDDLLLMLRFNGHIQAFRAGTRPARLYDRMAQGEVPGGLELNGVIYELQFGALIATDSSGDSRTIVLPAAQPTDNVAFCETEKILIDPRASSGQAIAVANGHLYAFVSTFVNGALVDLTDGRRLDLPESGTAISMTTGADGKIYALTIDGRCNSNRAVVRRIDPITLRQEAIIDTQRPLGFDRIQLVGGREGTYVHAVTATSAELLRVDANAVTPIALPADSGLLAAGAPDGSLYLYGGRARNVVSRFDPTTRTVREVDEVRGPDGSFVGALFFLDGASRP
ncbi:MAG: hypothetical protein E6J13_14150 [Chloroflexi bacterium]|nr:MAG: hypothetical protein E6J13_14150 [Chloroflexota bacterium]